MTLGKYIETDFRNELKKQSDAKNSRFKPKYNEQIKGSFSLINQIENEEKKRKNAKDQYVFELKQQIESEKRKKKQEQQRRHEKELQQEVEIQKYLTEQNKRYMKQLEIENNKKTSIIRQQKINDFKKNQNNQKKNQNKEQKSQKNILKQEFIFPNQQYKEEQKINIASPFIKRKFNDNYHQQLVGQKRLFQEGVYDIQKLNKTIDQLKSQHRHSRKLEQLRYLQKKLDERKINNNLSKSNAQKSFIDFEPLIKNRSYKIMKDQDKKLD